MGDGNFEVRGLSKLQCIADISCFSHHGMTQTLNHAGNHHPDERFVFDQKHGGLMRFEFRQRVISSKMVRYVKPNTSHYEE